ncbi:hypothetical protein BDZ45DRAFT_751403 [Acephala macrosclerotiorum]|nr:hypothetical protein BDZ45DRAFT_751403 [Acephala macrosclerotiorum]
MSSSSGTPHAISIATPFTSFKIFGELPPEIQAVVWEMSMPAPRVIKLSGGASWAGGSRNPNLNADYTIPILLHVNKDSREIGLLHYKLLFFDDGRRANLYVDFARDTVYIRDMGSLLRSFDPAWSNLTGDQSFQQNLRHLMFGDLGDCSEGSRGASIIRRFSGLKTVALRKDEDSSSDDDNTKAVKAAAKQTSFENAICKDRPEFEHPKVSLMTRAQMEQKFLSKRDRL